MIRAPGTTGPPEGQPFARGQGFFRRVSPHFLAAVGLFAFSVSAGLSGLSTEFVFDDVAQVAKLTPPRNLADWAGSVAEPWWSPEKNKRVWRPCARLLLRTEKFALSRFEPEATAVGYRGLNLVLHGASVLILFGLARAWGLGLRGSTIAGVILAIHPFRSEALYQIVGQSELLAASLIMGGLSHHLGWLRNPRGPTCHVLIQSLFFLFALGSKEHAILYPIYLGIVDLAVGRCKSFDWFGAGDARRRSGAVLYFGLGAVALCYLAGRWKVTGAIFEPLSGIPHHENPLAYMSFGRRLPAVFGTWGYGATRFIIPFDLSPDYSWRSLPWDQGWRWPMAGVGAIAAGTILVGAGMDFARRGRIWPWIVILTFSILLTSNLVLIIGVAAALRLWYLPLALAGLVVGTCAQELLDQADRGVAASPQPRGRSILIGLGWLSVLAVGGLWIIAGRQLASAWHSEKSFAEAALRRFPDCWRAHHNLAREFYLSKQFPEGLIHARRAVELRPDAGESWDYRGLNAMFMEGGQAEAEQSFRKAIELDPDLDLVYQHLGNLMHMTGRPDEAKYWLGRRAP